ncbi:LysE family translocator [Stenotrophomonas sp. S48]|uniref:LysE family translocator n=1 Tax=unclassified Stenotrophomonas TaxID=196198 RepID=UPI001900514F|nr:MULTISPECIES: LysE family translocator [unclassified Stenotrophomonas]MBK0026507.1 LysE family translocator [Stenotrophomonas sp. S48]MBK0049305.1 LysE family translocator [Stenotrophomonas sp. S49]
MALQTWWWFLATVFVLCGTPGPNMLHILGRSVGLGFRRSVPAMAGCLLAMLLVLAASAAGLSAVLRSSPLVFDVLRYLGVAYLAWLGIKAWRDSLQVNAESTGDAPLPALVQGHAAVFRGGLLVGLSNPKLLLFAAAFLPQFIDPARAQGMQYAVLVVTFAGCELFWYVMYAAGGHGLRRWLAKPFAQRWFERLVGTVFLAFAVALLRFRPR